MLRDEPRGAPDLETCVPGMARDVWGVSAIPGNRRAEGGANRKGVIARWGLKEAEAEAV